MKHFINRNVQKEKIAIIGLGYVGLPLAVAFGKHLETIGFDVDSTRINELKENFDGTLEISEKELRAANKLEFSNDSSCLDNCSIFIVTVPTPVDDQKNPNFQPLEFACETIGKKIKPGSIVVFESTVYPGATEELCVPILEKNSGLKFNRDFFCGYSPERINPGDKLHRLPDIVKIVSGSTQDTAEFLELLYGIIVTAGIYVASSIKVAEAAKVIENTQRDLNIALMNELALIFNRLNIDTEEVLEAAGTKWNFLPFRPGLVGGHCIGVDPYYLTYKAKQTGYNPEIILAGRRINDNMSEHIATQIIKLMIQKRIQVADSRVLILGLTFKENCPDTRNSKVFDLVIHLQKFGASVEAYDPWIDPEDFAESCVKVKPEPEGPYDAIVLAVAHSQFIEQDRSYFKNLVTENAVIFDVKSKLPTDLSDCRL
ncbi:MAG: nucleotide sugar dehydrogenase [Pseudomonadota bacterium]